MIVTGFHTNQGTRRCGFRRPTWATLHDRSLSKSNAALANAQMSHELRNDQSRASVKQQAVLYEEHSTDQMGKRYVGSASWRTETISPGPGKPPEPAVHADVDIPERHMTMTWLLRRNDDRALPATHEIEIMFNLPADFSGGGVGNVPGVLMKQSEQARGTALAGVAVKIANGFFLLGLSAVEFDAQQNVQLLKRASVARHSDCLCQRKSRHIGNREGLAGRSRVRGSLCSLRQFP